ncbi:YwmB family TATA-box binding protein [Virgibacillus ainsalahensis]
MRKVVFISLLFLCITTETMAQSQGSDEMMELAALVTDSNLSMEEWQVTIKEKMNHTEINNILESMENSHLVTMEEDENSIKYSLVNTHKMDGISEHYNVVIPKDGINHPELIAVIGGTDWNESIEDFYQTRLDSITRKYFTNASQTFTWLKAENDDIIKSDSFLHMLAKKLELQHMEKQFDNVENSMHEKILYGYTSLWDQKITIENIPMNLQAAVTVNQDGNRTYTVGTPILINEY